MFVNRLSPRGTRSKLISFPGNSYSDEESVIKHVQHSPSDLKGVANKTGVSNYVTSEYILKENYRYLFF